MTTPPRHLSLSLLLLRLGIFIVFLMWTLDKFVQPEHASQVFAYFYRLPGMTDVYMYTIGASQMILILLFAAGLFKTLTYAAVAVLHAVSTLTSYPQYLQPFDNLLYFAAWPMLAACIALFLLREHDTLTLSGG
jgi:putative oxidoreductase